MAVDMGVFSKNFNVMNPSSIAAFKDWTDSMVTISKVDIGKSEGIVSFINDAVSAAFGGGGSTEVPADKPPQDYSEDEKKKQVEAQNNKEGASKPVPAAGGAIDTNAIVNAITSALSNLTVDQMTVINFDK